MKTAEIENLPEVHEATKVLQGLEKRGLVEPAIASGWIRTKLTSITASDIDVSYVGPVHWEEAQRYLQEVISELEYDPEPWDIKGIWNAQMSYGVQHTVDNYLLYYVCSIDSVYLASDGKLYDPTGHGFEDAKKKILRINQYDRANGRQPTPYEEVNVCLEGCRRIAQHGWSATSESLNRIIEGVSKWELLEEQEKAYFIRKLGSKFSANTRTKAQAVYANYGWDFLFEKLH